VETDSSKIPSARATIRVFGAGASGHVTTADAAVLVVVSIVVGRVVEGAAPSFGELALVTTFAPVPPHPEPAISTNRRTAILRNESRSRVIAKMMHPREPNRYLARG
jgi:hypothetical protein